MALRYKVGDLCITQLAKVLGRTSSVVPDGTLVRLTRQYGDVGWYIDDPRSHGWWSENFLILASEKSKPRSGFAKFIRKVENV